MKINLSEISPRPPKDYEKDEIKDKLMQMTEALDELQNLLYAQGKHSVLIVMQGLDASGKDGAIKNVF